MFEKVKNYLRGIQALGQVVSRKSHLITGHAASWKTSNDKAYAAEGYAKNVVTFRCVDAIGTSLASVDLKVRQHGEDLPDGNPLSVLLKKPNPVDAGAEFFRSYTNYVNIVGNTYMEKLKPSSGKPPTELWVWTPFQMEVLANQNNQVPRAYKWTNNSFTKIWDVDFVTGASDILHWKKFNPANSPLGMSPMKPGAMSIDQHNSSSEWNQSMLQNDAMPTGVMTSESGISSAQAKNVRKELDENHIGPINARKVMVLEGKLKFEQLSINPKDMDWLKGHKNAATEICAAFGVPPQIIGIEGSQTFANYGQARLAYWEDTVLPTLDSLIDELNMWLSPDFGEGVEIYYDPNSISALEEKRNIRLTTYDNIKFLTVNEKRKANGFDEFPNDAADELFQGAGEFPLGFDLFSEADQKALELAYIEKGMTPTEAKAKVHALIQS